MPGKTEQVVLCRLTSRQRSLYEDYIRSDEVLSVVRGNMQLLKAVTVLSQVCGGRRCIRFACLASTISFKFPSFFLTVNNPQKLAA